MRDSIDRVIGVVDSYAVTISCSDLTRIGETNEYLVLDLNENTDIFVRDGYTYKPFGTRPKPDYAVFVEGTDEIAAKFCNILAISFASIKQYYDEKYDRNNFIKNVILENILPGDIYVKARELHFNTDVNRVVLLIRIVSGQRYLRLRRHPEPLPGQAEGLCLQHQREATLSWSRRSRAVSNSKDIEKLARSIVDTLGSEFYTQRRRRHRHRGLRHQGAGHVPSRKPRLRWRSARCSTPKSRSSATTTWASPA